MQEVVGRKMSAEDLASFLDFLRSEGLSEERRRAADEAVDYLAWPHLAPEGEGRDLLLAWLRWEADSLPCNL